MHKTIAEAEAFIAGAAAARLDRRRRRRRASARRSPRCRPLVDSTRGSRVEVFAQNMHEAPTGAFTGEISRADAHRARRPRRRARPLRAPPVLRRDRQGARARRSRPRSTPGLKPILCVGETEDEREAGDTERKLRHQVQEGLEKVPDDAPRRGRHRLRADLGDRHRQGRHARAGPGGDRLRARAGRPTAPREQAERSRILYGGSVKPDNAAELLALPDVDGALVGGASLDADAVRGDRRGRARGEPCPVPSCVLVVLDGWGLAPPGPGQRGRRWPTRRSSTTSGRATRTRS